MFNLYDELNNIIKLEVDDIKFELDLSFDNVLFMYSEVDDEELTDEYRRDAVLLILTDLTEEELEDFDEQIKWDIFKTVLDDYVQKSKPMMIPPRKANEMNQDDLFSYEEDADYIWASFFMLNINLDELKGSLHWWKFQSLIEALPDESKFKQVVQIRAYKPSKDDSDEYKQQMKDLQIMYELGTTQEDVEFMTLDKKQQQEYLREHPDYAEAFANERM